MYHYIYIYIYLRIVSKVRELIAIKVLHTSLLNTTVVAFKVLPLGSYASMPAPSPPFKTFWNWFCGMAFRAAVVLLLMSSMSPKCLPFNISFIFGNRKKSLGARSGEQAGCSNTVICLVAKTPSQIVPCEQVHCRYARSKSCWQNVRVVSV